MNCTTQYEFNLAKTKSNELLFIVQLFMEWYFRLFLCNLMHIHINNALSRQNNESYLFENVWSTFRFVIISPHDSNVCLSGLSIFIKLC